MDVLIPDEAALNKKIAGIKAAGINTVHVVADFDRTITRAKTEKGQVNTSYAHLREGDYLSKEYHDEDKRLFSIYYPMENDPDLSHDEKYRAMVEWWDKHWHLFIDEGITKAVVQEVINDKPLYLRIDADRLFNILKEHKIPMIIFSAGMGDFIAGTLKRHNFLTDDIQIISNFFKFDDKGKAIDYSKPLIHSLNKNESQVTDEHIKERKNIILLGDSLGDVGMAEGTNHDNIIKIGFLNNDIDKNLENFKESYDVIILNDGPMTYVVDLFTQIFS